MLRQHLHQGIVTAGTVDLERWVFHGQQLRSPFRMDEQ
jgi:hypothetical protein